MSLTQQGEKMEQLIEAKDVVFGYPAEDGNRTIVLRGVSLSIAEGSFVAVLGHNGSGKSTIAKHFNAILLPDEGTVTVCGIETTEEEKLYDIRQQVGMVFQNPDNQIVATIVEEDVAFGPENLGVPPQEIRARVDEALADVGMTAYMTHAPHQLSGGQKQRIAIAGVIAMRPRCIVLDEPTAMLDPKGRREVLSTIRKLGREHGITVVLITHYMEEAAQADRVVVMNDGEIMLDDTPREVFRQVERLKAVGLDVPQVTELCWRLRRDGCDIPADVLTEQECIDALSHLLEVHNR